MSADIPESDRARFEAARSTLVAAGWKVSRVFSKDGTSYWVQRFGRAEPVTLEVLEEIARRNEVKT